MLEYYADFLFDTQLSLKIGSKYQLNVIHLSRTPDYPSTV